MGDFGSLGVDPALCAAISSAFGIEKPSEIQEKAIIQIMAPDDSGRRKDVLIRSKTGSGKTLSFLCPIINQLLLDHRNEANEKNSRSMGTLLLVIVPTRELAAQTQQVLCQLEAKLRGRDHWIVSGTLSGGDRRKNEKERLRRGLHIVVGTPGRLLDHLQNTAKWAEQVERTCRWVVLDEADRLLDLGFEKSIKDIFAKVATNSPQVILCSATVDAKLKQIFGYQLQDPVLVTETPSANPSPSINSSDARKNKKSKSLGLAETSASVAMPSQLEHFYICPPTKLKFAALVGYLEESFAANPEQKIVLFTICCDTVDYMFSLFSNTTLNLLPARAKAFKLHGNLAHPDRIKTFQEFSRQKGNCVMVCTDVAARGLNLSHVTCIVQYDAPCDANDYIHRAGRTARQEEKGKSVLFLMPSERDYIPALEEKDLQFKSIRWDPLVELALQKTDLKIDEIKEEDIKEDDQEIPLVSLEQRKRIFAWLEKLQKAVRGKPDMLAQGKKAFLSFIRAYATHPASEKSTFHIRKLHLGHLAATFLLSEAPKTVASNNASAATAAQKEKATYSAGKRLKGPTFFKTKKIVSEFDAGDIGASFVKPRNGHKLKRPHLAHG